MRIAAFNYSLAQVQASAISMKANLDTVNRVCSYDSEIQFK